MNTYATPHSSNHADIPSLAELSTSPETRGALKPLTDDALVSRTRAGDIGAFEELLGRHEQNLFRLARRFVCNEHDAQEVLQDVFVTTWRKLPGFEDRAQIGSWLYRVTVNASLMHLRGRSRRPQFMDFGLGASALDAADTQQVVERGARLRPDEQLEAHELRRVIQRAVDKLPATLRSVFQMREIQGWSTRQAARSLGITEAAVKARLHRARLALRDEIEGYLVQ